MAPLRVEPVGGALAGPVEVVVPGAVPSVRGLPQPAQNADPSVEARPHEPQKLPVAVTVASQWASS